MRKYIIILALLLASCGKDTGLAPAPQIPPIPAALANKRGQLPPNNDISMGGQTIDNTNNIRSYNSAANQVNSLIDYFNCIRESINNKKEPKCQ